MSEKKSGQKSGRPKPGTFAAGTDPRRGRGPAKGAPNAGRPPNEFKELMRELASRDETMTQLRRLITGKRRGKDGTLEPVPDEIFLKAFKEVADRGFGKAVQPLEHAGPEGGPIPFASPAELRERITRELAGLAARKGTGADS